MNETTRGKIVRVGVDLAKRVLQVHAVDEAGRVVVARPVPRAKGPVSISVYEAFG